MQPDAGSYQKYQASPAITASRQSTPAVPSNHVSRRSRRADSRSSRSMSLSQNPSGSCVPGACSSARRIMLFFASMQLRIYQYIQFFADAVEPYFDVGLRHLRDPGAFAYGVLFVVEERDECPLFGLQLTDGTGQSVEVFLPSLPGIHPLGFAVGQVRQPRLSMQAHSRLRRRVSETAVL